MEVNEIWNFTFSNNNKIYSFRNNICLEIKIVLFFVTSWKFLANSQKTMMDGTTCFSLNTHASFKLIVYVSLPLPLWALFSTARWLLHVRGRGERSQTRAVPAQVFSGSNANACQNCWFLNILRVFIVIMKYYIIIYMASFFSLLQKKKRPNFGCLKEEKRTNTFFFMELLLVFHSPLFFRHVRRCCSSDGKNKANIKALQNTLTKI